MKQQENLCQTAAAQRPAEQERSAETVDAVPLLRRCALRRSAETVDAVPLPRRRAMVVLKTSVFLVAYTLVICQMYCSQAAPARSDPPARLHASDSSDLLDLFGDYTFTLFFFLCFSFFK